MNLDLPITDKSRIESLIPQKKPFVMVDELVEFSESKLTSAFTVLEDNIFVENGTFQASGLLEHQAQSVALYTGYQYFKLNKPAPVGYIGAVKKFIISELPKLGDCIITNIEILNEMAGVTLVKIVSELNGNIIAEAEIKTVLKE